MRAITLVLVLIAGCCELGCSSYLTSSGRQQAAYERYVRRCSKGRVRLQQRIAASRRPPPSVPSDPMVSTSTGPESVTSGTEAQ